MGINKNLDKICSYCGKEDVTVNREAFDGLCADCTDLSLTHDNVSDFAKRSNSKLKNGYKPWPCPCESTRSMGMCDDETCDGIFFWCKD